MTEGRKPAAPSDADALGVATAVDEEEPVTDPVLPDTDGADTIMLDGPTAREAAKVTVRGLGAPAPEVHVHRSAAEITTFETLDDVSAATAMTAHDNLDGDDLDRKIRRHLAEGHQAADPLIGSVIGERFEVISKLGAGGMGAVYRARQRGMGRDVAIKVLHQDLAQNETLTRRFTIEALAVSRLKHPNTIQIFDFGRTDRGNLYIAMELLEGQTLNGLLKEQGRVPIRRALRIIAATSSSLAEAHAKEIIHRDLKPENIFLTQVGDDPDHVKVLDFGVAKLRDGAGDGKGTLTKAGSIFGTPRYMSPEQASARPLDARSDLYSLGVILFELICGEPPFDDERPLQLLIAHANRPPPSPSSVCLDLAIPQAVEELILRLLDKSPFTRIQTARELANQCLSLAAQLPDEFEEQVPVAKADKLRIVLSTPTTLAVPRAGDPDETLDVDGPVTVSADGQADATIMAEPTPQRARRTGWVLMGVGVAGVSLLAAVIGLRSTPTPTPGSESATPAQAPPVQLESILETSAAVALPVPATVVHIAVLTRPAGARVHELDGVIVGALLGTTPLDLARPRDSQLAIRVLTGDHRPVDRELRFDRDMALDLTLLPVAGPLKPLPETRPRRTRKSGRKRPADKSEPAAKAVPDPQPKPKGGGLVDDLM